MLVQFMQFEGARESFMDLPALSCTFNLHEAHQKKNHSLSKLCTFCHTKDSFTRFKLPGVSCELKLTFLRNVYEEYK